MMLQLGDDGVVTSVNEEELVYVDKNELEQLIENYQQLKKENEQLKQQVQNIHKLINSKIQSARELGNLRTVIALKNLQRELKGDDE